MSDTATRYENKRERADGTKNQPRQIKTAGRPNQGHNKTSTKTTPATPTEPRSIWATERGREDLKRLGVQLRALSPHGVLSRGYSITRDSRGNVVRSVADVEVGQSVRTTLSDGELDADITGTTPGS